MKQVLLILFLCLSSLTAYAQSSSDVVEGKKSKSEQEAEKARKAFTRKRERAAEIYKKINPKKETYKPRQLQKRSEFVFKNQNFLDFKAYNFGIYFGMGYNNLSIHPQDDSFIKSNVVSESTPIYKVGLMGIFRVTNNIYLTAEPGVNYTNRKLTFNNRPGQYATADQKVFTAFGRTRSFNSTYLNLPVFAEIRADRIGNLRPYFKLGYSFGYNFSSTEGDNSKSNLLTGDFVMSKWTSALELGFGIDSYLDYIKLSYQVGASIGMANELVDDASAYTQPIKELYNRAIYFSIIIEQGQD